MLCQTWYGSIEKKIKFSFFFNREAARLSSKCVNLFTTVSKEEKEAVHLREEQLHKLLVPTAQKVLKWYQEHKNKLNLTKNVDVSDKGLESLIKLFTDERKIREDVVSSCNEEMPKNAPKTFNRKLRN